MDPSRGRGRLSLCGDPSERRADREDADREAAMQAAEEGLRVLAGVARKSGIVLTVENLPRTCLAKNSVELLRLISVDPDLRVCFDTNHLLCEPTLDFMDAFASQNLVGSRL